MEGDGKERERDPLQGVRERGEERGDERDSHSLSIDCLWKRGIEDRLKNELLQYLTMKLYRKY